MIFSERMKWNFAPLQAHDIFPRPSDCKIDFDIENVREWLEIACALFVYLYASVGNFCVHFFVITMYAHTHREAFMSLSDMEGSRRLKGG